MKQFAAFAASIALLLTLAHFLPETHAQFTPPAIPRTYADIATPSVNPTSGNTTVYTKSGTVCGLSPTGTETCTGSGGGGTTVTVAAPYITVGGTKYVAATMFPFSAFPSLSALDAATCTQTANPNGSESYTCALNTSNAWYSEAATASVEAEFGGVLGTNALTATATAGIFLCDSTNNKIYEAELVQAPVASNNSQAYIQIVSWTLSGCNAGTPSSASVLGQFPLMTSGIVHLKMSKVSSNIVTQISFSGGDGYHNLDSRSVGTIAKGGVVVRTPTATTTVFATWLALVIS